VAVAAVAPFTLSQAPPAHAYVLGQCVGLDYHNELICITNACSGDIEFSACQSAVLTPAYKPYPPDQQDYPRN
jgi:hypothetical protein